MAETNNYNMSVSGSQDESEGEGPRQPLPLLPIVTNKRKEGKHIVPPPPPRDKYSTLRSEYPQAAARQPGYKKKFNEDLRIDRAKIFKKTFVEGSRVGNKKKHP